MKHTLIQRTLAMALAAAVGALGLAGCAGTSSEPGTSNASDSGKIKVVASVNTWGNLAELVGGKYVAVKSIITDPLQDPHSYEATVRDELAVKKADLVLANGENYDVFMDALGRSVDKKVEHLVDHVSRIVAAENSATAPTGANPHIWYSTSYLIDATNWLAKKLTTIDRSHGAYFAENRYALVAKLESIRARETAMANGQKATAIETESIADFKLSDLGIRNVTPQLFWNSVIHENEVSPKALNDAKALIRNHKVNLLILNAQEDSVQGKALAAEARAAIRTAKTQGLATTQIVSMSELLPRGLSIDEWMTRNLDALEKALRASTAAVSASTSGSGK